jgi:hypothetical protein
METSVLPKSTLEQRFPRQKNILVQSLAADGAQFRGAEPVDVFDQLIAMLRQSLGC